MSTGILTAQFVTQDDPVSDAIRALSGGLYSHVDIVWPGGLLLGAHQDGVKLRTYNYGIGKWTAIKRVQVELPDIDAAFVFFNSQRGKPYNFGAIANMFLQRDRPFTLDQPSWFCDELLYAGCLSGGKQMLSTPNPLRLTPWEVFLSPYWENVV